MSHRRTSYLNRWTEYCSKLYTHTAKGDPKVLDVPPPTNNDSYRILREEVEAVVKLLKKGKSAGVDSIPSELVQAVGEAMTYILLIIFNKIWRTGEQQTPRTQSRRKVTYKCAKATIPSA